MRVRSGEYEFEIECSKEDLGTMLELTDQFVEALGKLRGKGPPLQLVSGLEPGAEETPGEATGAGVPQVTARQLPAAIVELLASPWGKEPRTMREITDALELNAMHYSPGAIGTALIRLTRQGRLRRLKKGEVLSYVVTQRAGVDSG